MKNILNKYPVYKGKSVMIIETSIGVNYGEANPFVQMKFAPRADANSNGQWDDANCFWLSSYAELYNFVAGLKAVADGKQEKYEMKNPKKGVNVQIRASKGQDDTEYISFGFYRGDVKIQVPLVKAVEFPALFGYFQNLVTSYNTVCAIALMRNDIWYEFVGKNKASNDQPSGGNKSSGNKGGGNNRQQNNTNYPEPDPYDGGDIGGAPDFGSDVPF